MNPKDWIGKDYPAFTVDVEKGRLRAFAQAIGENNPIHHDPEAAKKAGFASLVAPPTFAFTIIMDAGQSFNILAEMGIEKTRAVHGEQHFTYHRPILAGDVISGRQRIVDMYDKKNGALWFIVADVSLANQRGEAVCDLRSVIVVRNG